MINWTEREICRAIYYEAFKRRCLIAIPNCNWTGSECDLLVVRKDLRLIDIEVKISRADLKADAKKEKWIERWRYVRGKPYVKPANRPAPTRRRHPAKIFKHYYCVPQEIWKPELFDCINADSGVLLIISGKQRPAIKLLRHAVANPDACKISAEDLAGIARLATVRCWEAYNEIDTHRRALESRRRVRRKS